MTSIPPLYCGPEIYAEYLEATYGPRLADRYRRVIANPSPGRKPCTSTAPIIRADDRRFLELSDQVLAYLATGEKSAREIASQMRLGKTQVHRLVSALMERGKITRTWGTRHRCPPLYLYRLSQPPSMKTAETD